ncbi:MAG: hypothetical protein R3C10_00070 [Pirellulales bacterium]
MTVDQPERGYLRVISERMVLDPAVVASAEQAASRLGVSPQGVSPVLAYLANTIAVGGREVPYSTVAAVDFTSTPPLGPFPDAAGNAVPALAEGEIALNRWTADQLDAQLGDTVRLAYFEPESTHGEVRETTSEFRLAAIVDIAGAADDRALCPRCAV